MNTSLPVIAFGLLATGLVLIAGAVNNIGHYAFSSTRLISSKISRLNDQIKESMSYPSELRTLLVEAGILDRDELIDFEKLQTLEKVISELAMYEFDKAVFYLPQSIGAAFQVLRTMWLIDDLKVALCCIHAGTAVENWMLPMARGLLTQTEMEIMVKARDTETLLDLAKQVLPPDMIPFLITEPNETLNILNAKLDKAVCYHLEKLKNNAETLIEKWIHNQFLTCYVDKNIVLLARLKRFKIRPEVIQPYLLPVEIGIETGTMKNLLEASDYTQFLSVIRDSNYRNRLPSKENPSPLEIEEELTNTLYTTPQYTERIEDFKALALQLLSLISGFHQIRKALFFVVLQRGTIK